MTAVVESTRNHHIRFCDGPSLSLNKNLSEFSSLNGKDDTGDVWSCYYMPLTPPYSPVTLIDPTKETEEDFGCDRLQPVCLPPDDILGETLDNIKTYRDVNSVVIKDCMWGAQDVPARTQQRKRESKLGEHPTGQRIVTETFDSSKIVSVDPTEVFPSSLAAEGSLDLKDFSSCSDSDDDSDIDVVTVEAQDRGCGENENIMDIEQDSVVLASPPKTPDMVTPTEEKKIPTQSFLVLNLEALKPKEGAKAADAPPAKRTRLERDSAVTLTHGDKYSRASHNVLERKRRNELKSKFYRLRDSIPEMSDNKKVPKVAILKQAICYVHSLQREEAVLLAETDKQKQLATQLKNRIVSILRAGNVRK